VQNGRPQPNGTTRTTTTTTPTNGAASNGAAAPASLQRLPHHEVIRVAARASVDPKTVRRYLQGGPCHATTSHRIALGLAKCGLAAYVRSAVGT
jgi:hypothetical protein